MTIVRPLMLGRYRSCIFFTPQLKREESLRRIFGRFPEIEAATRPTSLLIREFESSQPGM
jgi:hypothetical protein